jgi:orotate phosphoribosyltransferase
MSADLWSVPRDAARERRELASDLVRASYLRGDFLLDAGNRSNYYFDKYLFETRPAILRRLAPQLAALVPADTDRLGAPELGAVLLGAAVSLETGLSLVLIRSDAGRSPEARLIEGELHTGERVALLDDVVASGSQIVRAGRQLADAGATVNAAIVVVDREEGGEARIREAGLMYLPLFRKSDLALG